MQRILSVWLPHWPIIRLRQLPNPEKPLVTAETIGGVRRLVAVAPEADGLEPGQTLADARALCPGLIPMEADAAGDLAALTALAAWAERYAPLAAVDVTIDHGLWLDISGCTHLFGGADALLNDFSARLARHDIPARMALAGTTGAAWALARTPMASAKTILPPHTEQAALADLPVAALRLDPSIVSELWQLGVRTIENLARLPRGEITARFGPTPILRLDQAFGVAAEAIAWPHSPAPFIELLPFSEPIGTPDDLFHALALLAEHLCARLAAEMQGGVRFTARFFCVDNQAQEITVATARPMRDAAYLTKLLAAKLEAIDPGFGVEAMTLAAESTLPLSAAQAEMLDIPHETDRLATLVDRLTNDLGADRVWRPAPRESHVPECAVRRLPPLQQAPAWERNPSQPRPIRLLRRPEPIEVTAPVPDDPPILFRWRRRLHRVRAAAGPERIAAEWWLPRNVQGERAETDLIRDYYRVEDAEGARFWIFRTGLHGNVRMPLWFLHGLFA